MASMRRHVATLSCCLLAGSTVMDAHAFIVNISSTGLLGGRQLYLRVGDGAYTGTYTGGGTPRNGGSISTVSVVVPAAAVGNGVAQAMTTNATQATSFYDGYAFCNLPSQVYVGGYNRGPILYSSTATLTATAPTNLTNADGDTIPFSQIKWTSTGNGDGSATQPFPGGTFTGGSQSVGAMQPNTWSESCHSFSYANTAFVAAGTYTGRVTYTLSAP
jgi:hypothetical protein